MWLFSSDGDIFGGARLYLAPGTSHLFGRTSSGRSDGGERVRFIEHKQVSRKHLVVAVAPLPPGSSGRVRERPEVSVVDNSKLGTWVGGEKVCGQTKKLAGRDEWVIRLGNWEMVFRLRWEVVTLTFAGLGKKGGEDTLLDWRRKLEGVDVKLVAEYVANETSHVVARKRNVPAVLQALAQGRWAVTEGWVEALATAARSAVVDGEAQSSLLSEDFDANWPREEDFVTPSAGEPLPRPDEYMRPNAARAEVFQGFSFVFLSAGQYENLLPVVTAGGGKALLYDVRVEETTVDELVQHVRQLAGKKGNAAFSPSQKPGKGGVVVVRLSGRTAEDVWIKHFIKAIDSALEQRSTEQNEFLDAILTLDASGLRRTLEEPEAEEAPAATARASLASPPRSPPGPQEHVIAVHASPDAAPASAQSKHDSPPEHPAAPPKKRARRTVTQSRFKGFDDVDPSQFTRAASESPEPGFNNDHEVSQAPPIGSNMSIDAQSRTRTSRKRPAPVPEEELSDNEEAMMETMLPGAAALKKRRRIEAAQPGGSSVKPPLPRSTSPAKSVPAPAPAKQVDVTAALHARRLRTDEAARADEESLLQTLAGVDIASLRDLAVVEPMHLPLRNTATAPDRWNTCWNGRRDFKKFRRARGNAGAAAPVPHLSRVIVTLEECARRGQGIGEEYWLSSSSAAAAVKAKAGRAPLSAQSAAPVLSSDGDDSAPFRQRLLEEDHGTAGGDAVALEDIAGKAVDEGERGGEGSATQTLRGSGLGAAVGEKRPAPSAAGGAAKRARRAGVGGRMGVEEGQSDGEDEVKFRRRRR